MSDSTSDIALDAQLRQIPLPAGLKERLHAIATWPDLELEHTLGEVSVPSTLAERLRRIPTHEVLDHALANVPVPEELTENLYRLANSTQPASTAQSAWRWNQTLISSLAMLLLISVTIGYGNFAWLLLANARPAVLHVSPLVIIQPTHELPLEPVSEAVHTLVLSDLPPLVQPDLTPDRPEIVVPPLVAEANAAAAAVEASESAKNEAKLAIAMREFQQYVLGAPVLSAQDVLELETIHLPSARGVLTPLVPGYDRGFLLRTNIHPPVAISQHAALRQSLAPLTLETDSFDRAQFAYAHGRRLNREEVQVEDFLATLESGLDAAPIGTPALAMAGGPSPFGPHGSRWLGLNVRTGKTPQRTRSATHLVVVVELSPRLVKSGTWDWLRAGLLEFLGRLGTHDRLSILLVQREVLFRSGPLDAGARDWLRQALPEKAPFHEPDTGLALQAALNTALVAETPAQARHVVLVTEGRHVPSSGLALQLRELGADLAPAGLGVTIAEVGNENEITPAVEVIAQSLRSEARKINSRRRFVHLLQQEMQGDEAITAAETRLTIRFQPETVASYRLVGHEANAMAQLVTPATQIDLHPGDETHVLFELLPQTVHAEGEKGAAGSKSASKATAAKNPLVAECELTWVDPVSKERRSQKQKFLRDQFASSWEEAPFWLRQATLASETAEWLRGSRIALRDANWSGEINPATKINTLARDLRSYGTNSSSLSPILLLLGPVPARSK